MGYRFRKQLIIVSIIFIFFGLIGFGVYYKYFFAQPTCSDGKQNQDETGIDCGGTCISCDWQTIKDIQVDWVKYFRLEQGRYDVAAKINNPNPNFGLGQMNYTFKFFNSNGTQVAERAGKSFILPDQQKYLIEGNILVGENFSRVELEIDKNIKKTDWAKINTEYSIPNIYVHGKEFKYLDDQPGASQAVGNVKNDSAFDFEKINIATMLFDASGQIVGVNRSEVNTVLAGEDRYFSALWYTPIDGQVHTVDMQADTNLLSDQNFMSKYGVFEKFQEYGPAATNSR